MLRTGGVRFSKSTIGVSIQPPSTFDGGLDTSDSTARLSLQSYQAAGNNFFGEVVRMDLLKPQSKAMLAWRLSRPPGSDPATGLRTVTWVGAHWAAQDNPNVIHGHWSVETPDASDALQTRFEILFSNQAQTAVGSDKTLILTNKADLVVRCDNGQRLRLKTGAGAEKLIEWGNADWGGSSRWTAGVNADAESGSNVGANLEVSRFNDSGVRQDAPIKVTRSNGQVQIGGDSGTAAGMIVRRNSAGSNVQAINTATGGTAFRMTAQDAATSRAIQADVTGESGVRFVAFADGKHEWGDGTNARDTNLYRSAADVLKTDDSVHVGADLRHLGSNLGFYNATAIAKPEVTGSRGGNAALADLLTKLANLGLITNSSTA